MPTNAEIDAFLAKNTLEAPQFGTPSGSGGAVAAPAEADVDAFLENARNEEKYGGTLGGIKAAALGAGTGASFGLSNQFLTKSGLVKSETIKGLMAANPVEYAMGEVGGVVGSAFIPGANLVKGAEIARKGITAGAMRLLPEATSLGGQVLQRAGAGAIGSAAEGALYGAGMLINDQALGDPDLNAEKVMSTLGYSAAFGGAVGALLGPIEGAILAKAAKETPEVLAAGKLTPEAVTGTFSPGQAPNSLGDIANRVRQAEAMGLDVPALPTKQILQDAEKVIGDSQFPVHEAQLEALRDKNTFDILKAVKESDTPEGQALRDYDALMKAEGLKKLNTLTADLSPAKKVTGDAFRGGEETVEAAFKEYKARKIQDGEAFTKLKEVAPDLRVTSPEIVSSIQTAFPDTDLTRIINMGEDGVLGMKPYKSSMPISRDAYKAIKEVVSNLEDNAISVEGLRNVRNTIGDMINPMTTAPRAKTELGSFRKNLMDVIQGKVQTQVPDMEVREMFKRYAINEQDMSTLEKIFGGKLNDREALLRQVKPELLGDKIFSNSATIQEAKRILSKETFDQMAGNYLAEQVAKFTDQGTFSSKKFANWLKNNKTQLEIALSDNPVVLQKLDALAAKMSIIPDMAPLNPSGTAKAMTLQEAVSKASSMMRSTGEFIKNPLSSVGGYLSDLGERLAKQDEVSQLEAILSKGVEAERKVSKLATIERALNKTTNAINTLANKAMDVGGKVIDVTPGALILLNREEKEKKFDKIKEQIEETNSPDAYLEKMEKSTEAMYDAAPSITGSMQVAMTRATEFLRSKLPAQGPIAPLSTPLKPSVAEMNKFLKYYEVVENPLTILKQVRSGLLTSEGMEAMKTVYPGMLAEMRTAVMDKITNKKAMEIPYQTKVMLSFFLEQDLVYGVSSSSIMANQASFAAPSQKQDDIGMARAQQKPSQKGLESITLSSRSQTGTEAITNRKS